MSANGRDGHITAYPLCWLLAGRRIPPHERVPRFAGADHSQGWDGVTQRLFDQLRLLDATDIILSTNQPLRRDGRPYAQKRSQQVEDPGVAVYFQLSGRTLSMAQDRFQIVAENVRSLALGLEGLRKMERHGGGEMMERAFLGFAALPAPGQENWWDILGLSPDCSLEEARRAYHASAIK